MRQNRLREKIQRRDTAYGVLVAWPGLEMVEFFGHLSFDYVFLDGEHGNIGPENLTHLVHACDVSGSVPIVRVPENSPATILRYLETGVLREKGVSCDPQDGEQWRKSNAHIDRTAKPTAHPSPTSPAGNMTKSRILIGDLQPTTHRSATHCLDQRR